MRQPAWFIAHGTPFHAVGDNPLARFWASLPQRLERSPRAILCVSAHWAAAEPMLAGATETPAIQHDFDGFPDALYQLGWPLPDGTETGSWLAEQLAEAGLEVTTESGQTFDHGVWTPLLRAWPAIDVPVFQLSLVKAWQGHEYLAMGEILAELRTKNVLIIGSGSLTHNCRPSTDMQNRASRRNGPLLLLPVLKQLLRTGISPHWPSPGACQMANKPCYHWNTTGRYYQLLRQAARH
ncbi:MAG: class III extradiol ring-cleavage dioxygenase [Mariprofundaceae bacterium]|nr:class III extradiol ring-cleavage dioxygenase [Mariprofundaceae bacterium]